MTPRAPLEISIVVPVYRGAGSVGELAQRIHSVMHSLGRSYEIIFVNDGSPDDSATQLRRIFALDPERVVVVELMRNFGQHNALMCGFRLARGEFVITMDDDLQNAPEDIPKLIAAIEAGNHDLVYGDYGGRKQRAWRNMGSIAIHAFHKLVFRTSIYVSSYRIIRREVLASIFSYDLNFTFIDGLLAWNTQRIGQVAVEHHPRAKGRSGYSLAKLLTLALNLFTNFSLLPLQIASGVGLIASFVGISAGAYFLIQALLNEIAVPGYASIIVAVMILGGLQLLALGVIGEYVGRLQLNVNRKPQYTVRHVLREGLSPAGDDEPEASCVRVAHQATAVEARP